MSLHSRARSHPSNLSNPLPHHCCEAELKGRTQTPCQVDGGGNDPTDPIGHTHETMKQK